MNSKTILLISRHLGLITHDAAMSVNSSMGSLSKDNGDGNANGLNLRPFKLYRVYLEPLYSSDVGDFSWSQILKGFIHVQIEKGKFVVVCPRPP